MIKAIHRFFILFLAFLLVGTTMKAQTVITIISDTTWRGASTSPGGTAWMFPGFVDTAWRHVEAPNAANVIPVVPGSLSMWSLPSTDTAFMRKTFTIPVGDSYSGSMSINADNEFYMYFNGVFYGHENNWFAGPFPYTVTPALNGCAENVIALITTNFGGPYGCSLSSTFTVINPLNTPTAISATAITCNSFTARWTRVSTAGYYLFDVSTDSNFSTFLTGYDTLNVALDTSHLVSGLTTGTHYYYRLRAVRSGLHSCYSNTITVTPVVSPTVTVARSICSNDSIFLGRAWRRTAGTYYDTLRTLLGCDSTVRTNLTLNPTYLVNKDTSLCRVDSFYIVRSWHRTPGVFYDTLRSYRGCDSVIITTVHSLSTRASRNVSICNGQSFFAGGRLRTIGGTYIDTLTSSIRCDSILTTNLFVNPYTFASRDIYICPGSSVVLGGIARSTAGSYYDTLINSIGCDSILTSVLHIQPISTHSRNLTICPGGSIVLGGLPRTAAGTYYDTLTNYLGCDSILSSILTLSPYSTGRRNVTICPGGSILLGGAIRTTAGTYYDTLSNFLGCDSILSSILGLSPYSTGARAVAICANQSITLGGLPRNTAGTYYDTLSNYLGCDSILSTALSINPLPFLDAGADTSLCTGQSLRRLVSGTGSFVWNDGTRGSALIITPAASSLYSVSLTDANNCTSVDSINITVHPLPILLVQDTLVCLGKSARLHASGAASYHWSNGATSNATTVTPVLNTDYWVVGTDANGCVDSASIHVTVSFITTDIIASPDSTIHFEQSATLEVILSDINDSVISWAPNEAIDTVQGNIVHVTPLHTMYYSVHVININGCRGVDSILIRVIPPDLMVVPTGFSPNRDGVNDFLKPKLGPNLELTAFRIYNRYGEVVFDFPSNADQNGWDGMYKERDQPMGVYVWYGEARNKLTGNTIHNSGNVTLLR